MKKPDLSFPQIWNMNFGYLGIQFGWGLQLANMSAIYTKLGADPDKIPLLWLAGPMTGLLIQPVIGALSDRTWSRLGRRRPYFLGGAILASLALFLMPDSPALWCAAVLLWLLDASTNVSQEPFRAFIADKLNEKQRTLGFITLSFFVGLGHSMAASLPFILRSLGVEGLADNGIPLTVFYSFRIGALMFLLCVLWTVFSSSEYPPEDMEEFQRQRNLNPGIKGIFKEVFAEIPSAVKAMPDTMKQLAFVHMFTFVGLFCMWMFFALTTAYHVFGATSPDSKTFDLAIEWAGRCFAIYSIVCCLVAFFLERASKIISRKLLHSIALTLGGLSLISIYFIHDPDTLQLTMIGIGITWASTLSIPYAILASSIPQEKVGVYMGIFNFSIVIPEVISALSFQPIVKYLFNNNPLYVVMSGGVSLIIAAILVSRVYDPVQNESKATDTEDDAIDSEPDGKIEEHNQN